MKVPKLHEVGRLESTARVTKSNVRATFFFQDRVRSGLNIKQDHFI